MNNTQSTNQTEETQQTAESYTQTEQDKHAKIQKLLESSKKFTQDTKQNITFEPNVPQVVMFPPDWYLIYDDLLDEQITVHHKTPSEAAEYAEKHFRIRNKLEVDPNDSSRSWGSTTYRGVKLPLSTFPELAREIKLTSKNAISAINDELARISIETDSKDIILTITKKQGSTIYKTTWEVKGQASA